ncbi:MAG TPA: hypothetical protein VJT10_05980 [Steroidobacteraceae bacterium]|nr:hypothetical protein [Steroidobacteraceae bacterium]
MPTDLQLEDEPRWRRRLGEAITNAEEKAIFLATLRVVPKPAT